MQTYVGETCSPDNFSDADQLTGIKGLGLAYVCTSHEGLMPGPVMLVNYVAVHPVAQG